MFKALQAITTILTCTLSGLAQGKSSDWRPEYSTANFFTVDPAVRNATNMNVGWRFTKGDPEGAGGMEFDDSGWDVVNLPHGIELLPLEASGSINYQGPVWYRKRVTFPESLTGKRLFLHFEAIMGKSEIWMNGKRLKEHFGGFLPIHIDITEHVELGKETLIAVRADNSDDTEYPPGKSQDNLDFAYFGGIYRDVWLITTNSVYITNPNAVDHVAGGGLFIRSSKVSEQEATLDIDAHLANHSGRAQTVTLEASLRDRDNKELGRASSEIPLKADGKGSLQLPVTSPNLWEPDNPYLHNLIITVRGANGEVLDTLRRRVGIRSVEFRGRDGFYLNGKPFPDKLIGANRHQDFAHIGNALPNSLHWRDAQKLRNASCRVIRCAHYPQDPAFMDACDELGLFVIVATPGWQFWNPKPHFRGRVISDIRNMVRRDRNHPSVILWEPILNETHYPDDFARQTHDTVHEEYPYSGCYTACDGHARGKEYFDLHYQHPELKNYNEDLDDTPENQQELAETYSKKDVSLFTREWGDSVDNWSSHNSPSRVSRSWGEGPQLTQALHYSRPPYRYSSWSSLYRTPRQHVGGTLWHSFDHQRGYHPDPFWGGIMTAFRQPKYSYYLFKSQMDPKLKVPHVDNGPFVHIAHEMTPFSGKDIMVFSNCDAVRVKFCGKDLGTLKTRDGKIEMPHLPAVFKGAFDFRDIKGMHRKRKANQATIVAEGLIDGKVVVTATRRAAARRSALQLSILDTADIPLTADGSDLIPVVATFVDRHGTPKRLSEDYVRFTVSGEGELVDDGNIQANPRKAEWGEAPALIRATHKPGTITVQAEVLYPGIHASTSTSLTLRSHPAPQELLFSEVPAKGEVQSGPGKSDAAVTPKLQQLRQELEETRQELMELRLKEVEQQQEDFEQLKE